MSRQQQNQATIIRDLLRAVQDLGGQQAQAGPASVNTNNTNSIVEQFRRYKPPTFNRITGPLAAEEWIRGLERIFKHLSCTDAQKILCAEFMLVDAAGHWWEFVSRTRTEAQQRNLTWARFKEKVMGKYFPQALRDRKETEFLQLKQGKMTLVDYERKFEQLSRYAVHLVNTEQKKARRFELRLRPEIGGIIASHEFTTYIQVLQRAQAIANRLELDQTTQENTEFSGKRKWNGTNEGKGNGQNKRASFERRLESNKPNSVLTPCPKYNKAHRGECLYGNNVCYRCGKQGHIATNCQEPPPKRDNDQSKKGPARVFALTQQEATEN
ncbi:uncharacterized protein LOC111373334 [Olea europaea var. sylvestris]|uniref:uncharacterized protein LOC111373334 n=1 Tax=Olea europaea var. sylvestris TaxID=158386 RepID=UPI000C1CDE38|nr:uncharacterized protein LOC111373334 [Olea europaea var. sylvestris]